MGLLQEFKTFALKGNVVDMAVGVIIGGAFGKVVTSMVEDLIMPPVGVLIGGIDFSELAVVLKPSVGDLPEVSLRYGKFIQNTLNFAIVAMAVFALVKMMNSLRAKKAQAPAPPAVPAPEVVLLGEIRDLLAGRSASQPEG